MLTSKSHGLKAADSVYKGKDKIECPRPSNARLARFSYGRHDIAAVVYVSFERVCATKLAGAVTAAVGRGISCMDGVEMSLFIMKPSESPVTLAAWETFPSSRTPSRRGRTVYWSASIGLRVVRCRSRVTSLGMMQMSRRGVRFSTSSRATSSCRAGFLVGLRWRGYELRRLDRRMNAM
ncbi:hypothetical protein SERLADRAFT_466679, partial [Serpula lacrymans var. lacrymans S7.9]